MDYLQITLSVNNEDPEIFTAILKINSFYHNRNNPLLDKLGQLVIKKKNLMHLSRL